MDITKDFHIHSIFSRDGRLAPESVVTIARRKGLKVVAVTDHNTIEGGLAVRAVAPSDLEVIVGAEIYTNQGELIGLGLEREIESRDLREVVREIHSQGGKVYVPHPFDRLRRSALRGSIYDILPEIDFIESFNGRCLIQGDNDKAAAFAEDHGIPGLRGSDGHFAFEIGNLRPGLKSLLIASVAHALTVVSKYMSPVLLRRKGG